VVCSVHKREMVCRRLMQIATMRYTKEKKTWKGCASSGSQVTKKGEFFKEPLAGLDILQGGKGEYK